MPPIKPVKRRELISYIHKFGFDGPFSGGRHQFMQKDNLTLTIPIMTHPNLYYAVIFSKC